VPDLRTTAVRFGAFEVFGRVGFGGMGEVFRARVSDERSHSDLAGSDLALKLLRPEYAVQPHFRDMFMAEARVGAFLHHPNIVSLYDVGEIEGMLYLATELVDGVSLDRILDGGALPTPVAVHVAVELLDALHYAHELAADTGRPLNIVHRDVSASNTLISQRGEVKLTDFGLAKIEGLSLTLTDEVKGKRAYMAPEQLEGGPMDRRVDVFAMGVLVHELVTRKRPFSDVSAWVKSAGKIAGTPFDGLIAKALAPRPADRFASAAELAAALCRACPPAPDARRQLSERVRLSQEALRPLNKFDRIFLDELAGHHPSAVSLAAAPLRRLSPGLNGPPIREHLDDLPTDPLPIALLPPRTDVAADDERAAPPPHSRAGRVLWGSILTTAALLFGASWMASHDHRAVLAPPLVVVRAPQTAAAPTPPLLPPPATATATATAATDPPPVDANEPAHAVRAKLAGKPAHAHGTAKRLAVVSRSSAAAEIAVGPPGYLLLDTDPWATVYLGSARLGTTPLRVPLPPGRHALSLQPKDATERRPLTVVITSGQEQRMSMRLR
jgi:serine/threonine-protein kinase